MGTDPLLGNDSQSPSPMSGLFPPGIVIFVFLPTFLLQGCLFNSDVPFAPVPHEPVYTTYLTTPSKVKPVQTALESQQLEALRNQDSTLAAGRENATLNKSEHSRQLKVLLC